MANPYAVNPLGGFNIGAAVGGAIDQYQQKRAMEEEQLQQKNFQGLLKHEEPILFPDITYSFYPVYCGLFNIEYKQIPLREDFSLQLDDILGQLFAFFVLTIAAAESCIGLAIIILYYRNRGNISFNNRFSLKS